MPEATNEQDLAQLSLWNETCAGYCCSVDYLHCNMQLENK